MTTLCFVFGGTQAAPSLFLYGFRKNRDFAGISLGSERFLGEEEQAEITSDKHATAIQTRTILLLLII